MVGKIIVIDGVDGSGKQTQADILVQAIRQQGQDAIKVDFPRYKMETSIFVRMYLDGRFGENAKDVNPYAASTFYALDRYASFMTDWKEYYDKGTIIVCDRYVTSNMVHQAGKIIDRIQRARFLKWLMNFEYDILGLPRPDGIFFLSLPPQFGVKMIKGRELKNLMNKDIHEADENHLIESYNNAMELAKYFNWHVIDCLDGTTIRSISDIHCEIFRKVEGIL